MCENEKQSKNCIYEILNIILLLQENAVCSDLILDSCEKCFLGNNTPQREYNTRPIALYVCNGTLLEMPTTKDNLSVTSGVFRIEKLENNCATFRVLIQTLSEETVTYTSTNSFFTVNLNCICAIKCLSDTYVESL